MAGCPAEHRTTYQFLRGNSWQLVVEHFGWGFLAVLGPVSWVMSAFRILTGSTDLYTREWGDFT